MGLLKYYWKMGAVLQLGLVLCYYGCAGKCMSESAGFAIQGKVSRNSFPILGMLSKNHVPFLSFILHQHTTQLLRTISKVARYLNLYHSISGLKSLQNPA